MGNDDSQDLAAIESVFTQWCAAWKNLDTELMLSLYTKDDDLLVYQSEENRGPLYRRSQLEEYWVLALKILKEILEWRVLSKKVSYLGDTATIYVILNVLIDLHGMGQAPGELRASLMLRKDEAGQWTIYHYHESRQLEIAQKTDMGMDDELGVELPPRAPRPSRRK